MKSTQRYLLMAAFAGLLFAGCGPGAEGDAGRKPLFKVNGKITMSGGPVANAMVSFSPKNKQPVATGRTNTDGQFTLTTYDPGDGAAEGDYVVLVTKELAAPPTASGGHDPTKPFDSTAMHKSVQSSGNATAGALPEKYSRADRSDLNVTVKKDGPNDITLELKP